MNLWNKILEFWFNILGLPPLASKNGKDVDDLIIYVHWLMVALFVGWLAYFAFALWRFRKSRNPKGDYHGVRSHASNYIELAVVGVEAVLLLGFAIPWWARAVDKLPDEKEAVVVQVVAQQFAWNFRYGGKDGEFGRQDMHYVKDNNLFGVDPNDEKGKDDV